MPKRKKQSEHCKSIAQDRFAAAKKHTPSDEMISAAHSRVKSWMEGQSCQSVLWTEKATQLYAEHENSKIKKKIGYSSPEDIYKANSKKQQKKQDIIPI